MHRNFLIEQCRRHNSRGFTLIELLVVISIIALLASLSLGAINQARIYSNRAACSSNLQEIGVGLLSFAADHDGMLPESGGTIMHGAIDQKTGLPGWTEQIENYMGSTEATANTGVAASTANLKVYRCPDSSVRIPTNKNYSYFQGAHPAYYATSPTNPSARTYAAVRLSLVSMPSITIMGGDIASSPFDVNDTDKDDYTYNPAFPKTITIHGGYSNILFYDGHVAACKAYDNKSMAVHYDGPDLQPLDNVYTTN